VNRQGPVSWLGIRSPRSMTWRSSRCQMWRPRWSTVNPGAPSYSKLNATANSFFLVLNWIDHGLLQLLFPASRWRQGRRVRGLSSRYAPDASTLEIEYLRYGGGRQEFDS